jgi:hypothetical protein
LFEKIENWQRLSMTAREADKAKLQTLSVENSNLIEKLKAFEKGLNSTMSSAKALGERVSPLRFCCFKEFLRCFTCLTKRKRIFEK